MAYDTIHNIVSKKQTRRDRAAVGQSRRRSTRPPTTSTTPTAARSRTRPRTSATARSPTTPTATRPAGRTTRTARGAPSSGTRRTASRASSTTATRSSYKYDDKGERVIKRGPQGETAYVNQYFTIRNRTIGTKHVYVGTTRLASKLVKPDGTVEKDQYFFHPDHLGSSNYVTDANGGSYEHLEYFPFGETWVEEASNTQRTPYLFTGKELDEETGLYYYGARYYDPRTSQFISADPLLVQKPAEVIRRPGLVGAFSYALNNPIMYTDPDGRDPKQSVKPILIVPGLPENPTMEDVRNALQTAIAARLAQGQSNSTGAKAPAAAPSQASGGKRDITPTEAQPLVEAAKFLASKNVPYAKRGRQSDLTSADCTGAVGMIYDMAGMHYEGVGGANVAGNVDFKSKFRELGAGEKPQVGDIILWPNKHAAMFDPNATLRADRPRMTKPDAWSAYMPGVPFGSASVEGMNKWHGAPVYYRYQMNNSPGK